MECLQEDLKFIILTVSMNIIIFCEAFEIRSIFNLINNFVPLIMPLIFCLTTPFHIYKNKYFN